MFSFKRSLGFACILGATALTYAAQAETYTAYAGNLPPFSISPEEKGFNHELVEAMAEKAGVNIDIQYLPWKQAQAMALKPNSFLIGPGRTASREAKYQWVARLVNPHNVFAAPQGGVLPASLEEAKTVEKVTVLAGTPRQKQLDKAGVTNYIALPKAAQAAKLMHGRQADVWYTLDQRAAFTWMKAGFDIAELQVSAPISRLDIYLASSKQMDEGVNMKMAEAFEELLTDGTYAKLEEKYFRKTGMRKDCSAATYTPCISSMAKE